MDRITVTGHNRTGYLDKRLEKFQKKLNGIEVDTHSLPHDIEEENPDKLIKGLSDGFKYITDQKAKLEYLKCNNEISYNKLQTGIKKLSEYVPDLEQILDGSLKLDNLEQNIKDTYGQKIEKLIDFKNNFDSSKRKQDNTEQAIKVFENILAKRKEEIIAVNNDLSSIIDKVLKEEKSDIPTTSRSESKNALLHELKKPLELIYRANQTVSSLEATLKKYQETLDAINSSADSSQKKETTGKSNNIKKKMEEIEKKKGEINKKLTKYKTIYKGKIDSYKDSHGITDENLNLENLIKHREETYNKNNHKSKIELLKSIFKDFIDVFKINKISKIDISKIKKRAQSADTTKSANNNVSSEQTNTHDTVKKVETELRSLTRRTSGESLKDLGKHSARLLWEILRSIGKGVKGFPKRFGRAMVYEWDNHKKRGAGLVAATVVGSFVPGVAAIAPFILPGYYGYRIATYNHYKEMSKKYGDSAKQSAERKLVYTPDPNSPDSKIEFYIPKKKARPREISYLIRHETEKLRKEGNPNLPTLNSDQVKSLIKEQNLSEGIDGWKVETHVSDLEKLKSEMAELRKENAEMLSYIKELKDKQTGEGGSN